MTDELQQTPHVAAEVAVEPLNDESIRDELVIRAIDALDGPDVDVRPGLMSSVVSDDLDAVLHAVQRAHVAAGQGAERVLTTVRLESRDGGIDLDARAEQITRSGAGADD